jgi:exopolysaccharide/PEP-CTERM locus tyrosine autokinase
MSLIEQAAKRLEELRRAGVEMPDDATGGRPAGQSAPAVIERAVAMANAETAARQVPEVPVSFARETAPVDTSAAAAPEPHSRRVALDLETLNRAGLITPAGQRSRVADEYRVIKRPLLANATGKGVSRVANGNLIMVTSALPGEGKSFTAVNLAMSIAMELDHTVLLVDADVARPSVPRMLGLEPTKGLLDVLVDESVKLRDVLMRTDVEKLTLLQAGTQHPRATELLASDAMYALLDEMAQRYSDRIIIFDSPPLLVTTESRVLATHMGQVVVVVEAKRTQQSAVKQAIATIEACPVKMMVLNKSKLGPTGDGYGYGYGYGYGQQ